MSASTRSHQGLSSLPPLRPPAPRSNGRGSASPEVVGGSSSSSGPIRDSGCGRPSFHARAGLSAEKKSDTRKDFPDGTLGRGLKTPGISMQLLSFMLRCPCSLAEYVGCRSPPLRSGIDLSRREHCYLREYEFDGRRTPSGSLCGTLTVGCDGRERPRRPVRR